MLNEQEKLKWQEIVRQKVREFESQKKEEAQEKAAARNRNGIIAPFLWFKKIKIVCGAKCLKLKQLITRKELKISYLAIGVIVLVLAGFCLSFYLLAPTGKAAQSLAAAIPIPIARVNQSWIQYSDFLDDFHTLSHFYQLQNEKNSAIPIPADKILKQGVVDRLIRNEIIKQLAKEKGIAVDKTAIENEIQKIIKEAASPEEIEQELQTLYKWDLSTFKEKVVVPYLLQQKVAAALANDLNIKQKTKQKADRVLTMANQKKSVDDFADLAKLYSDAVTAYIGGDLGFIGFEDLNQELKEATSSLKAGEISDLIETEKGYEIIFMEEKVDDEIHLRHILIAHPSLNEIIDQKIKNASIWRLIRL